MLMKFVTYNLRKLIFSDFQDALFKFFDDSKYKIISDFQFFFIMDFFGHVGPLCKVSKNLIFSLHYIISELIINSSSLTS